MRDYGKVHTSFWSSDTLRGLDDDAKMLALYLMTCPHGNMAGVFRVPLAYAVDDMRWDSERLRNGFKNLSDAGWLYRCDRTGWVWVVKWLKWNRPDNPNQWKSVAKLVAQVPDSVAFHSLLIKTAVEDGTVSEPLGNLPAPAPVSVPAQKQAKKRKAKSPEVTFAQWTESLDGADAIPPDDPVFTTAAKAGIPREFVALAWEWMQNTYGPDGPRKAKVYTDWRQAFRNAVEGNWPEYWAVNRQGEFYLTTKGVTAQRAAA
ncbi:MAG TPA: hypothetical protein VIN36_10410 [Thiobacillus sp.]